MATESKRWLEGFEERDFLRDGTRLRYYAGGSGPPVVLVHGLGGAAPNWRLIAPGLALERRVIVPELPGHGASDPLPGADTIDPFADLVVGALEQEEASPAAWVGHSLGGLVALRAAVRHPEAVTGIVLAAAAGGSAAPPPQEGRGALAR